MNITILGTGNVATVLSTRILQAGHSIRQIYGRNKEKAEELAKGSGAGPCSLLSEIDTTTSDIYILALTDTALPGLAGQTDLDLGEKLVVHTAGSVSKDILKKLSSNYGVLYPLQSLRKELDPLTTIPLLIDSNTGAGNQLLQDFARSISEQVEHAGDAERIKLHVAAVIASNFTNHLYAVAEDYCKREKLDFRLLHPLINETALRIKFFSPAQIQTGPAARKDIDTIDRHLALLQHYPAIEKLYRQLTDSILEYT